MFFHVFHQKTLDRFGSIVEEIAPWLVAHNQPMMSRALLAQDGTRHVLKTLLLSTSSKTHSVTSVSAFESRAP